MLKKLCTVGSILLFTAACSTTGESSKMVESMQQKDKNLTCKEVLLEMNEAEFYKGMAEKNKGPKLKYVLMPLGYISTYVNAEEAIEASNARVTYLERVYEIMDCSNQPTQAQAIPVNQQVPFFQQQPMMQQQVMQQPMMQQPMYYQPQAVMQAQPYQQAYRAAPPVYGTSQ